ncbi:hypothetical protein M501DRAFT_1017568 [Patellaria atrata CBS 101060]|uniref:Uncharacterized protein n=1 Tax=Patellaria atrata CBS 101060 TaxID=1346257 RepID=A0A9P4VQG7_9PEZI|nr:hypothetical protein M501DRAFT_1017568 [Patellaria atrata CBS 101060]
MSNASVALYNPIVQLRLAAGQISSFFPGLVKPTPIVDTCKNFLFISVHGSKTESLVATLFRYWLRMTVVADGSGVSGEYIAKNISEDKSKPVVYDHINLWSIDRASLPWQDDLWCLKGQ